MEDETNSSAFRPIDERLELGQGQILIFANHATDNRMFKILVRTAEANTNGSHATMDCFPPERTTTLTMHLLRQMIQHHVCLPTHPTGGEHNPSPLQSLPRPSTTVGAVGGGASSGTTMVAFPKLPKHSFAPTPLT